jgi:hypothetical protein
MQKLIDQMKDKLKNMKQQGEQKDSTNNNDNE